MAIPPTIPAAWPFAFEAPWGLLLAAAAAAPALLAAWGRRRGRHVPALNVALQSLAVLAAALALARPTAPLGPGARRSVLVLRDVSASCRGQWPRAVPLPADIPAERYDFAAAVAPAGQAIDANQTRLAPALHLAAARREQLAGAVLHTDGRFTDPDWRAAAGALGRTGLPLTIVPMESPPAEARLAALAAARRPDGKVHVQVTVEAGALSRRTLTVRRIRPPGGEPLLTRQLDLLPAQPATLHLTDAPPPGQLAAYSAELSPADEFPENDSAEAVVLPTARRLAVVGDCPIALEALAVAPDVTVERVEAAAAPQAPSGWMDYAAVLLGDAGGTLLARGARAALEEAVRTGTGLVFLGAGPHASPDDRDDPLNRAAALLANPYQRRPLDLTVILDASGSMSEPSGASGSRIKFDQAVEAVLSLRRHLTDADGLRVVTFSDSARAAYDSGGRRIDFAALRDRLAAVQPAGPTDVVPALKLAAAAPAGAGRDGLVLVVSDLATQPIARPDELAAALRRQKLSLAVVAIEPGTEKVPDPAPLETLARLLGPARVVRRTDLTGLAEVLADFLRRARGEALRRGRFEAAAVRACFGRGPGPLAEVQSYLLCAPQAGAEVLARVGEEGDPLLAARRVALGQSVTLAIPPGPADNPAWHAAGQLPALLPEMVRAVLRAPDDPRLAGSVRRQDDRLHVMLDAADANAPLNLLKLSGRLASARADAAEVGFPIWQTAPGRYEGFVPAPRGAAALAVLLAGAGPPEGDPAGRAVWQAAVARTAPQELQAVGADWASLRTLADLTAGRITPWGQVQDLGSRLAAARRSDLWPALLAVAVALMLLDWAAARIWRRGGAG